MIYSFFSIAKMSFKWRTLTYIFYKLDHPMLLNWLHQYGEFYLIILLKQHEYAMLFNLHHNFPNMFYRFILSNYVAVFRTLLPYEQVNMSIVILNVVAAFYLNCTMPAYLLLFYLDIFVLNLSGFTTANLFTSYDFTSYQCWGN